MVEAKSLAYLVDLADNPPIHYQDDFHVDIQALILYIARVPGSKDFFLTTIKPLEKVVRAEDVQSCLYYVHVGSEKDEPMRREEEERTSQELNILIHESIEENSGVPAIRRKPLPVNPALSSPNKPEPPPKTSPHYQPLSKSSSIATSPNRKIIGPRPMHNQAYLDVHQPKSSSSNENVSTWSLAPSLSFGHDVYPQRQRELDEAYAANAAPLMETTSRKSQDSRSSLATAALCTSAPALTLIRRYNNDQINAAIIHADGRIVINCPGYQKCGSQEYPNRYPMDLQDSQSSEQQQPGYECVLRSTSKSQCYGDWTEANSTESSQSLEGKRSSFDVWRYKKQFSSEDPTNINEVRGGRAATAQGYTFRTPWNGICEFNTGITGRSLKCKSLPTTSAKPTTISELRFNLLSSHVLRPSPKVIQDGTVGDSKRNPYFGRQHRRTTSSTSEGTLQATPAEVPDEDGFDLSLGQEHAGGGFGGKQAKLGKLVIEPKGLQMLDLLVAANMSVWWKVYGKLT